VAILAEHFTIYHLVFVAPACAVASRAKDNIVVEQGSKIMY